MVNVRKIQSRSNKDKNQFKVVEKAGEMNRF